MLIFDLKAVGNNLYKLRKSMGLTQAEVAERAELSDRSYADIERGGTVMRVDSLLKICKALKVTPNDILATERQREISEEDVMEILKKCSNREREMILKMICVYLNSVHS